MPLSRVSALVATFALLGVQAAAGVELPEGNDEFLISYVEPEETRGQPIPLDLDDAFAESLVGEIEVRVVYLDRGTGEFQLAYADTSGGRHLHVFPKSDSGAWKQVVVRTTAYRFANGLEMGADLLLDPAGDDDDVFRSIAVRRLSAARTVAPPTQPIAPFLSAAACTPTGGSGGLPPGRHLTTVAGLRATIVVPVGYDPRVTTYLGFFLHGDGGNFDGFLKATNPVTKFVSQRRWILVSPLAPNGRSWWQAWNGDHNQALGRVFAAMFARYNLCRETVFGAAGSGGSEFWTGQFFPAMGGTYPAHCLVACGGNDPHTSAGRQQALALGQRPEIVARTTFDFLYGTADRLVPGILQSIDFYRRAGFSVLVEAIEGGGHCNKWKLEGRLTFHQQIAVHWARMATSLGVP
jgi:hypothetical protein